MPFTADSELDLLFPAEHIPDEARRQLHADLHVRPHLVAALTLAELMGRSSALSHRPTIDVVT